MTLVVDAVSVASPFFLFVTLTLALIRRIAFSLRERVKVVTLHHFVMFLVCALLGYFIYFGNYQPLIEPTVASFAALLSLHFFVQAWSHRRKDSVETEPEPEPDNFELEKRAREYERQRSLEYMRMTAQAPGLRGGFKVQTLESDLIEIKQRLIDIEEVQMMILEAQTPSRGETRGESKK
jgi:hypothetical protein